MMPPFREVGIANEHQQSKIDRKDVNQAAAK